MEELSGGSTQKKISRFYADGSSTVTVREDFGGALESSFDSTRASSSSHAMASSFAPSLLGVGLGSSVVLSRETTAQVRPQQSAKNSLPASRPRDAFANETNDALAARPTYEPRPFSLENEQLASYREGALMTVQDSDDDFDGYNDDAVEIYGDDGDDDWSVEPQNTIDEEASGIAGEGRWRSKLTMSSLASSAAAHVGNPRPVAAPDATTEPWAAAPAATTNGTEMEESQEGNPEMGIVEPDLPPAPPADVSRYDDSQEIAVRKKSATMGYRQLAPSHFRSSDHSQAASLATRSLVHSQAAASSHFPSLSDTSPSDVSGFGPPPPSEMDDATYVAAEVGQRVAAPQTEPHHRRGQEEGAAVLSGSQPMQRPLYHSASSGTENSPSAAEAAGVGATATVAATAASTAAPPGFAFVATASAVHCVSADEASLKTDEIAGGTPPSPSGRGFGGGGDGVTSTDAAARRSSLHRHEPGEDGVVEVPIATNVRKDDFRSHLLSHRRTQIGCAALALVIVGLAVGLGVALGGGGSDGSSSSSGGRGPGNGDDASFWQNPPPVAFDGKRVRGDFGASVSMNQKGTRVAIGSPDVWDEEESSEGSSSDFLRRGVVEVREFQDDEGWVPLGDEIVLSARDGRGDILMPNVDKVRNLIQVVLSADGDTVAVGTSFHDDEVNRAHNAGQVEVFRWDSLGWIPVGDPIVGTDAGDFAGASIALSDDGGFLAVGSPGNDDLGEDAGCVRIFFLNRGKWNQLGNGSDDDGTSEGACPMGGSAPGEMFGGSVSLSADGKKIAVGLSAMRAGDVGESGAGKAARVFKFVGGGWSEMGNGIDIGEHIYDTAFSAALSKDGTRVIISNHYVGENGPEIQSDEKNVDLFVGAFRYDDDCNQWAPMGANLHMNSKGDKSGYFITLSDDGTMIGMGDPGRSVNKGKVAGHAHIYVYDDDSKDYRQFGPNIEGEAPGDRFGYEVSLSGNGQFYAVGAPSSRSGGFEHGRVQVFKVPGAS